MLILIHVATVGHILFVHLCNKCRNRSINKSNPQVHIRKFYRQYRDLQKLRKQGLSPIPVDILVGI